MRARDNLARALTTLLPNNKVPNWVTYFGAEFLYTKGGDLEWFRSTDKVWAYKLQRSSWTRFVFAECFTRLRQVNKRTSSSRTNSRCLLWISEYWDDWMPTGRSIFNILLPLVSTSELSRVHCIDYFSYATGTVHFSGIKCIQYTILDFCLCLCQTSSIFV